MTQRKPTPSYLRTAPVASLAMLVLAAVLSMGAKRCERVRGCFQDGKHYDVGESFPSSDGCNSCSCEANGQVACTLRACLPPDSCGGVTCGEDEYCQPPANAACNDLAGTCTPRPEACTAIYDPVCGCDGNTYGNDCDAAMSGVAVASEGECGGAPQDGGVADGCDYAGTHYEVGASFPSEDGCNTCSCSAGGLVACTKRACAPSGICGGLLGASCPKGEYCSFPPDALCGAADATGTCAKIPDACTTIYDPVCGCDDKTYGNACAAASAGVSVASKGECDDQGSGGTCTLGDTEFEAGESVICADGCNQCSCEGGDRWISTLRACEPRYIEECEGAPDPNSGLAVTALYRAGDALALSVQYGGGCFPHTWKLCYNGQFRESLPVQTSVWLVDTTGMVDSCLALPTEQLVFDLSPLRELYTETYPNGPNTMVLNLGRENVTYSF